MYAANRANPPVREKDSVITYNDVLPNYLTEFYDFGTDTTRFSNLVHISAQYVVFAGGNAFHAFNVATSQFVVVPSLTLGGVTTVAATTDRQYLAIAYASAATGAEVHIYKVQPGAPEDAEQPAGEQDNVIIVDDTLWLQPQAVLRSVRALGVETMAFNADGTLLATVSSDPDFALSVWAWSRPENQLLLSAPAFSSVVMRVAFCRYTADALITGGRAHIKFWKMAQTFTGPKLKGDLAKFGVLDASDATGFLELPSGNFLHGCGTGELAFWDHTTVRMVFVRPGGRKCHAGAIEFLYMDLDGLFTRNAVAGSPAEALREELERRGVPTVADAWVSAEEFEARPGPLLPVLLTAGADGYICLWSGHQILQAQYEETMDGGLYYELTPVEEIFVGPGSCIRNMSLSPDRQAFIMQDAGRGGLAELAIATRAVRRLTCGHGGAVRSIALCNSDTSLIPGGVNDYMNRALARSGLVATLGSSGTLFLHDLISRQLVGARQATTGSGTKVVFIHNGLCLVSGYTDGTVRFHAVAHGYLDAASGTASSAAGDAAGDEAGDAAGGAAGGAAGECLNLLCAYRCFPDAVVDITCNAHGVVAVLSVTGTVFLIQVGLSLVRRERAEDLAGAGEKVRLNVLASGLLNVRNDEALSAAERHSLGLAQRNQRGHLGVTVRDVVPLGYFDAFARVFGEPPDKTPRTLRNIFFVDPTTLCFAVCNAQAAADRLAALATPSLQDLLDRRAPDTAAGDVAGVIDVSAGACANMDMDADAGQPARQSTVSYAIDDLLPAPPVFVGVAIPATPLPGTTEATMGRIERHVTQRRIAALMPSKGVMEDALNALLLLEAADAEAQKERAGGPGPDGGADGDADADGDAGAAPRAPRRTDQSDPLLEDASAPQEFDFVQVSLANAGGFTTTTADEDAHLVVVVRCFVDRDVRNRAESAMASVRARAEAAASGAAAGATNAQAGDPAFLQAALAVADLRAAYRSSLVYTFSLAALRKAIRGLAARRAQTQDQGQGPPGGPGGPEGPGAAPFLYPCVVAPAGQTSRIIDAALLSQEQLANPEFAPDASETPRVLLRQPLLSFPLAARRLQDLVVDADTQRAVADAADTGACMAGNLFTALDGGALCVQPFEAPEEFCALRTDSLVLNRWWTSNHAQAVPGFGIAAMEAGLGGHVLVCGDEAGRVLAFCTKEFAALLESATRKQQAARLPRRCGLHAEYVRDICWSTGTDMIRPPETVLFTDEVYGLVPSQLITAEVAETMDKQPNLVPLDSLDLQPRPDAELPTIEEARLLDIDSTASKHGRDLKATVLTKVDALRARFAALVRENAALPADKRLLPHQLCPDLLLANAWLSREEARAHEVICSELGGVLLATVRRIAALLRAFPVADLAHTVRAFSNPAQRVQSFQVLPLPPGFEEELCRVLGVESVEELARMMETRPAPAPALSERGAGDAGLSETGTLQPSDDESTVAASLASTLRTAEPDDGGLAESRGPPQPLGNSILTRTKGDATAGAKAPGGTRSLRSVDKVIAATLHGQTAGDQDATSDQDNIKARVAQRMAARAQRRAELKRLMAQKPDPEGISPEDEQSLQAAADTVGLFPLKTTEEYVAKLGQLSALQAQAQDQGWGAAGGPLLGMRDTRDGKWTEFLLTLKGMHDAKQEFNERVAVLLACKQAVVAAVRQRRARAVHVAAAVRRLAGPALAAELDNQLLQDLAIPDPDKLSAFVRLHPDERRYLKQLAALRCFAAGFDERLVAGRLEPTALCTRLAACFLADDLTHDDLLVGYIDACVADRLILPEEAARLRGLVDAPGRACASIVEEVVFATSALLGGKSFGAARRRARARGRGAGDAGHGSGNGDESDNDNDSGSGSEDDGNDGDGAGRADEDPNAQLLGDTRYTADVILGTGRAYGRSTSFAATLQAQRDYDARALLAPHANPNVNVAPATDGYDASKPLNAFCGAGTSGLYAERAGDWLGILLLCRHRLSAEIAAVTAAFDASVRALQHAGLQLQTDFCRMRIRLVTLFQEAEIHHLYVTRDARCMDALEGRRAEQQAISAQLGALCKQIVARTREAQGVGATLQRLLGDVQAAIPLEAPYRGKLLRLYTRRCKAPRAQKRPASGAPASGAPGGGPGGGPADPAEHGRRGVGSTNPDDYLDESEESSALSDISDGGAGGPGDADEPVDESAPPEGCSRELFEAVLRLRVQKRDADAALAAVHAAADQLRQQYVSLQKRERQTLQAIDQARRELTLFHAGKQRELNQVGTAALVTMGQYALLSDTSRLNPDLSGALLLDLATLQGLRARIGRRGRELQDLRALGVGLRAEHKQLTAQEGAAQAELRRLVEKAEAVQQLKFGRLVDISRLDRVAVNEPAVAVEEERAREEARHWQRREAQTRALDEGRDGLRATLDHNTALVRRLCALERESTRLDRSIQERQRRAPKAWCSDNKQELVRQEYNSLKQTIVDRERELRTLVDEIAILKNHGNQ